MSANVVAGDTIIKPLGEKAHSWRCQRFSKEGSPSEWRGQTTGLLLGAKYGHRLKATCNLRIRWNVNSLNKIKGLPRDRVMCLQGRACPPCKSGSKKESPYTSLVVQWTGIQGRGHRFSPELGRSHMPWGAKAHRGSCGAQVL